MHASHLSSWENCMIAAWSHVSKGILLRR
jgi:hypothetical protein